MVPAGRIIIAFNEDKPGVIGTVGNLFDEHGINIGSLTFGRKVKTQKAVLVLNLDDDPGEAMLKDLADMPFMESVNYIELMDID